MVHATAAAKSLQLCLILCDPIDGSPSGSSVPGILQARILEWLPFPSPMHTCMLNRFSHVQLCVTPWTAAHQMVRSHMHMKTGLFASYPLLTHTPGFPFLFSSVQFSFSVVSDSLRPHEPQHAKPPCPSPTPGVHPNPCPLSR